MSEYKPGLAAPSSDWPLPVCDTNGKLADEITRLRAEVMEQARLLGMGAEREAKLLARVEVLEAALHAIFPDGANIKLVPKASAEEAKP